MKKEPAMVGYMNLEERVDKDFAVARTFAREGARVFLARRTRELREVLIRAADDAGELGEGNALQSVRGHRSAPGNDRGRSVSPHASDRSLHQRQAADARVRLEEEAWKGA